MTIFAQYANPEKTTVIFTKDGTTSYVVLGSPDPREPELQEWLAEGHEPWPYKESDE